jgi:hypothetical protein
MWFGALNHIKMVQNPGLGLDMEIPQDMGGLMLLQLQKLWVFGPKGKGDLPGIVLVNARGVMR